MANELPKWNEVGDGSPSCEDILVRGTVFADRLVGPPSGGSSVVVQQLGFGPMGPDPFGAGVNMPEGYINDYLDPSMAAFSLLWFKGADNAGTLLTGIDSADVEPGAIRVFVNLPAVGLGQRDSGTVVLVDESQPESLNSLPTNRIQCPGTMNFTCAMWSTVILLRGFDDRWHVVSEGGWNQRTVTQALNLYPNMQVGTAAAPIVGNQNDWNPLGEPFLPGPAGRGVAGSNCRFADHTFVRMFVDAAGAAITGMLRPDLTAGPSVYGCLKVIANYGPGELTIANLSGLSAADNRIYCPNGRDLRVPAFGAVWLICPYPNSPDAPIQWRVLGMGNEVFPSVTTPARAQAKSLTLFPQDEPAALPSVPAVTSDWNPGAAAVIRVTTHANGSIIDGLVAADPLVGNEIRVLKNVGAGPLVLVGEIASVSVIGNRFLIPAGGAAGVVSACTVVAPGAELMVQADIGGKWRLMSNGTVHPTVTTPLSVTPAVMAAANVNDWNPVDVATGLAGRYAHWWRIQGAVGTNLTGIDASPAGLAPFVHGDRILLTNLASGLTIMHANGASLAANQIYLAGGANLVLASYGSVELIRDQLGNVWYAVRPS